MRNLTYPHLYGSTVVHNGYIGYIQSYGYVVLPSTCDAHQCPFTGSWHVQFAGTSHHVPYAPGVDQRVIDFCVQYHAQAEAQAEHIQKAS